MMVCDHGQLKRSCLVCELQEEITRLKDENEIYKTGIETLNPEAVLEAEGKYLDEIELLKAKLSRYEGGVEVDAVYYGNAVLAARLMLRQDVELTEGQRVCVLVMKEEA